MFICEISIIILIWQKLKLVGPMQQQIKLPSPKEKKLYGPFLWTGFNCLKAGATLKRQFTFYH